MDSWPWRTKKGLMDWYKVDLHIHTPASECYHQEGVSYFDIVKTAEERGLDIIALADHNTVRGYSEFLSEIRDLEFLESLDRLRREEKAQLDEYRRILRKVLVLPGFEFTATFGFHILAVFSEKTLVRDLEHLLLLMGVPSDQLDMGTGEVGATVDVLTAYRMIRQAGGIVIAAHANSSHGVVLQGLGFGGQTKIAFTQDANLHALEVTDYESRRANRTATFFDGSRPEYPRRMHIIQSSDAHRLDDDAHDRSQFGVGGRAIEVQLSEPSFEALKSLFESSNFKKIRPYRWNSDPANIFSQDRKKSQDSSRAVFHERMTRRGGLLYAVIRDIAAFANTEGGTVYVGASGDASAAIRGLDRPDESANSLREELRRRVSPMPQVQVMPFRVDGRNLLRVSVQKNPAKKSLLDGNKAYVRNDGKSQLLEQEAAPTKRKQGRRRKGQKPETASTKMEMEMENISEARFRKPPPRTGVEVVSSEKRNGVTYYALRDLRNRNVVTNVTKGSARRLWRYAIGEHEKVADESASIRWQDDVGLIDAGENSSQSKYNLAQLDEKGNIHYYYGVTGRGLPDEWKVVLEAKAPVRAEASAVQ